MPAHNYDALIVGGGPGGSATATFLARAGRRVLVLERERFPRFHVGESLLPYNRQIFQEMGVWPKLESRNFPRKLGAQFHLGNSSKGLKLVFSNGRYTRETEALQVERSVFDDILLKHAAESGAEVLHGWTAGSYATAPDGVKLTARGEGQEKEFTADFLIDASGRANLTGNAEGLKVVHPHLKKVAVFGHFKNVFVDEGSAAGDTVIVPLENKWFWIIPLGEKVSVGAVLDQKEFAASGAPPAELFRTLCDGSTEMRSRMAKAVPVTDIQVTGDFSYYNQKLAGRRLLRVGDAAGFMDPIFSAGVYMAMYSGRLAALTVNQSLKAPAGASQLSAAYEKEVFRAMRYFWIMVEKFYTRPFMELFMEPRPKFHLPDAIVALLAGEVHGGLRLKLRRKLFFLLVGIQARFPLVPGLSFEEPAPQVTPSQGS